MIEVGLVDNSAYPDVSPRHRTRSVSEYVREDPLSSMAIAAAAGFIIGGGLNSRLGQAMLAIVGRVALQSAATNFLTGMVVGTDKNGGSTGVGNDLPKR